MAKTMNYQDYASRQACMDALELFMRLNEEDQARAVGFMQGRLDSDDYENQNKTPCKIIQLPKTEATI